MGELSRNKRKAIASLIAEPTVEGAAAACGLGPRTVYRYLSEPVFKAALRARQDEVINSATAALAGLAGEAIDTLRSALHDHDAPASTRVRAALGILDQVQRLTAFADLENRISDLESSLALLQAAPEAEVS